jgi:hypothetical protein
MSRGTRLFLIVSGGVVALTLVAMGATVAAVHRSGTIAVDVREAGGGRLAVHLPAAVANLAINLVPSALLRDATRELRPWLPATLEGWGALERADDFVLVEVLDGPERVRVAKRGTSLDIEVEQGTERYAISVPLRTVRSVLSKLDRG